MGKKTLGILAFAFCVLLFIGNAVAKEDSYGLNEEPNDNDISAGLSIKYDITGCWKLANGTQLQLFRDGVTVQGVYIALGFDHFVSGSYITPTKIKLIQTRRNRSNGCTTTMLLTYTLLSNTSFRCNWVALDSSCDLSIGQKGTDLLTRVR